MIVIPALHPAREIVTVVPSLRPGQVQRSSTTIESVGGKAINVARFASLMGGHVRLLVLADADLRGWIERDSVIGGQSFATVVESAVASRIDVAIVEPGRVTVINGAGADPGPAAAALVDLTLATLRPDDVLVLAGSLPDRMEGTLGRLISGARAKQARTVVDASGPWLTEALLAHPDAIKINREEAEAVLAAADDPATEFLQDHEAPWAAVRAIAARGLPDGGGLVAVSDGADGLRALIGGEAWRVTPPADLSVVNPLGAGDAVTAGLALAFAGGASGLDGLVLGTAMAAARLGHLDSRLDPADVAGLRRLVRFQRVD
ncbi:MAG: PfkB family carbohydrate kinase [Chloroflexota bacterium]|nr:PfkB family carbohydrate kinase [Chloroflexota bacterium]